MLILLLPLMAGFSAQAQNSLVVQVLPPYTNRLADYSNTPNKVMVIVTINPATQGYTGSIYFRGSLKSSAGDIEISTKPGYRPFSPIRMPASAGGAPVIYRVPFDEIKTMFDWNNLTYKGIETDRIVRYGMPEDTYQFCVQVFDYNTNTLLIDQYCSPPFNVSLLEPPMIITPVNGSKIQQSDIQNILFNWTVSPGAPFTTQYTLRLIEMVKGVDPKDALFSKNYPMRLFETTTKIPNLLYTNAMPRLETGKKYAFAVIASDSELSSVFRNNGMSEIYTFELEESAIPPPAVTDTPTGDTGLLTFTTPESTSYIAEINSKNSYTVSWMWNEIISTGSSTETNTKKLPGKTTTSLSDGRPIVNKTDEAIKAFCRNHNVEKYRLTFERVKPIKTTTASRSASINYEYTQTYTMDIPMNYDSLSFLSFRYTITDGNAEATGFVSGGKYRATVTALDSKDKAVATAKSFPFNFERIPEDNFKMVNIHAVVDYKFEGKPGTYHAVNAPITIHATKVRKNSTGGSSTAPTTTSPEESSTELTTISPGERSTELTTISSRESWTEPQYTFSGGNPANLVTYNITENPAIYNITGVQASQFQIDGLETTYLGSITAQTNAEGVLNVNFQVPDVEEGDLVYFKLKSDSRYYIDRNFTPASAVLEGETTHVNFGQQIAQVYGYSLKLYLRKKFTNNYSADSKTYTDNLYDLPEGITVALYRKNKKDYIPPVEGNIKDYAHLTGAVEVARGKTQVETVNGRKMAFVKFDNLLASPATANDPFSLAAMGGGVRYNYDEYYIKALKSNETLYVSNSVSSSKYKATTGTVTTATAVTNVGNFAAVADLTPKSNDTSPTTNSGSSSKYGITGTTGYAGTAAVATTVNAGNFSSELFSNNSMEAYTFDGFAAEEMVYKLKIPAAYHKDSLYRNVTANYEIVSTKPPISRIKGSLSYKWHSDPNAVIRPMAKVNFKVVVNYLIDGKFDPGTTGKYPPANVPLREFYYFDGSKIQLYDNHAVVGSGRTDSKGNFDISISNFNMKGDLGNVYSYNVLGGQTKSTPEWQQEIGNFFPNSFVNSGKNVIPDGNGGFIISDEFPSDMAWLNIGIISLKRVLRIVPDNPYYYPCMDHFIVQPMETAEIPPQCSYVKEVAITVHPQETDRVSPLDEIAMLIFRDPKTRTDDMPIGEGDGNRLENVLINPEYKLITFSSIRSDDSDALINLINSYGSSSIFKTKFEHVCLMKEGGKVTFTGLLPDFQNYYLEACSNPIEGKTSHYAARFISLDLKTPYSYSEFMGNYVFSDPDRWLGIKGPPNPMPVTIRLKPLQSRLMIRVQDNQTHQALPAAKIVLSDIYGFVCNSNRDLSPMSCTTDDDGYMQIRASERPLSDLFNRATGKKNVNVFIEASAIGYKPSSPPIERMLEQQTGFQQYATMNLEPAGKLNLRVYSIDEGNKPVRCYVAVDSAQMVPTNDDGRLTTNIPAKKGTKIRIIPRDLAYFNDTITITALTANDQYNFDVGLYRKKHRIALIVKDKDTGLIIPDYTVALGDVVDVVTSSTKVFSKFEFENVSIENYTFIVRGPAGSDYIPVTVNLKNKETKEFVKYEVVLEKGSSISGTVKFADNQPVKNAKVYLDISQETTGLSTGGAGGLAPNIGNIPNVVVQNVLENTPAIAATNQEITKDKSLAITYTDATGNYTLHGIPANNCKITVVATLDTTFTVIGDSKQASIINKKAQNVNLTLKKYDGMVINNLYGFPLTIESLTEEGANVKVTGLVHWGAGLSSFRATESYKQLRVENVLFKAENVDGKNVGVAVNGTAVLQGVTNLKLQYLDGERHYNVRLRDPSKLNYDMVVPLYISRMEDGKGGITGRMQIIDNSFNYTESYMNFKAKDDFYLAAKNNGVLSNMIQTVVSPLPEKETASLLSMRDIVQETTVKNKTEVNATVTSTAKIDAAKISSGGSSSSSGSSSSGSLAGKHSFVAQNIASVSTLNTAYLDRASEVAFKMEPVSYYLCNQTGGPIKLSLLEFPATAKPDSSYIAIDGTIHLNVNLECEVPNANPSKFTVNIKDLILDNNNVYPATGSKLNLALGRWTLEVSDWRFDPKEGGIYSENSLVRTAVMDIPAKLFILRSDEFAMKNFDYSKLKLGGGIANVTVDTNHANSVLLWDRAVGSDMQGHWRLSITSTTTGQPAATISKLPGLKTEGASSPDAELKLSYVQILDNNEATVTIANGQIFNVNGNTLAKFKPQSLSNGPDYVKLSGALNIGAPGVNDIFLRLKYTKPGSKIEMLPEAVSLDFAPSGKVHFEAKSYNRPNIRIDDKVIEIDGFVSEKATPSFNPMPAVLTARPNPTKYSIDISNRVDLTKKWTTQMNQETATNLFAVENSTTGSRLENIVGGMSVSGNNWSNLVYSGILYDNVNSDGINGKNKEGKDQNPEMTFTVFGDVTANSEKLELSGDVGFGKLTVKYEFPNSRLIGDIQVRSGVPFGPVVAKSGSVGFMFGKDGFYLAGGMDTYVTIPFIQGNYQMGFMVGYCKKHDIVDGIWDNYVQKYKNSLMENKCYLSTVINHELAGFYFALDRVLFDVNKGYGVCGIGFDLKAYAGVGVDFYANFSPFAFGVSGRAALSMHAEFNAAIARVQANLDAKASFDFVAKSVIPPSFDVNVNLDMGVNLKVQGCLPIVGCATVYNAALNCYARAGTYGFDFDIGYSGLKTPDCPPYKK